MTRHLFKSAALVSLFLASPALACRYIVDELAAKGRLVAIAKAHFAAPEAAVSVEEFRWFESKPTPMCPEELTFTARLDVYAPSTGCRSIVDVTHIQPWVLADDAERPADQFLVKTLLQECASVEE